MKSSSQSIRVFFFYLFPKLYDKKNMWRVQQVCGWLKAHLLTFAALHHPIFLLGLVVDWVAAARWCLLGRLRVGAQNCSDGLG